ncbi:hypothetical protein [Arsukibacterium sp. UBA3189]|uniref:hypothetical protein n=1 Tax=Arsukibacterium sp. UBA3189 TaxID=1946059 RepID=UPI000B82352D|nr:hypothetical protein [Arsukibacterium sp. UBA3189]
MFCSTLSWQGTSAAADTPGNDTQWIEQQWSQASQSSALVTYILPTVLSTDMFGDVLLASGEEW